MSHEDHKAYWLRSGDSWTKIDYSQKAETWMKPLVKGKETGLVEIPVSSDHSRFSSLDIAWSKIG